MCENGSQDRSIPVDQFPGPVCRYATEDGTRVVQATNDSFEAVFGRVSAGTPLQDALDTLGIDVVDGTGLLETLDGTEQCLVEVPGASDDSDRYLVQSTAETADGGRFLLFVDWEPPATQHPSRNTVDIDHIATIISHDLRNPLDVAKSRLEAGRDLDEDEHFEHVEWAHERMERIIEDVLTLARADVDPNPDEPVDLEAAARAAWRTVETDTASLVVEESLPCAVADEDRVVRLFENLFRNAVEHGSTNPASQTQQDAEEHGSTSDTDSNDEPSVTITVGPLADGSRSGFAVTDDGPGIPPVEQQRVFEPGYSRNGDGTGLGLAIVARIANRHGWSVDVGRSADGGARFEITGLDRPEN